jgi:hypothetical protein
MALTAPERETVILSNDEDDFLSITTSQRKIVTQLRANPLFELEAEYTHDGTTFLSGRLPVNGITIRKVVGGKRNVKRSGPVRCSDTDCNRVALKASGKCRAHS